MSLDRRSTEGLPLICEFCGEVIEDDDQRCPATDDGRRCRP
ncbi:MULTISPECIES: hypothetical protein [unclassified Haloarcula]|nr:MULTISPECIES: hypothetical protein [unclassified Haloarcula]